MKSLFLAEIKKNIYMLKAYKLNMYGTLIIFSVTAVAALYGIRHIFADSLNFFNLLLVPIVISGVNSFSNSYKFDTMIGVIEQIINSSYGLIKTLFVRYCIDFFVSIIPTIFLILIAKFFFDFRVNFLMLILVIILLFFICCTISLLLLGITFVHKNITSIESTLNILIPTLLAVVMMLKVSNIPNVILIIPFSSVLIIPSLPFINTSINLIFILLLSLNYILSNLLAIWGFHHYYNIGRKIGTIGHY